jgi:hypothetical protein
VLAMKKLVFGLALAGIGGDRNPTLAKGEDPI